MNKIKRKLAAELKESLPVPNKLETEAARRAATLLVDSWICALHGGWELDTLASDVAAVIQELESWQDRVTALAKTKGSVTVSTVMLQRDLDAFKERVDVPESVSDEALATALVRIILSRYWNPSRFNAEELRLIVDDLRAEKEGNG